MIDKNKIEQLVNEKLSDDLFLVDLTVSAANVIHIMIDSDTSVSISQIVEISRFVESNLDREAEDFELSVFSAGLTEPFMLVRQYKKNLETEIDVLLTNGTTMSGTLVKADDEGISLEVTTKEKPEGAKRKELVTRVYNFGYQEIKKAKKVLKF